MQQNDQPEIVPETAPATHWLPFGFYLIANCIIFLVFRPALHIQEFFSWNVALPLGLATYRVSDIIANEQVTKVIRAPFVDVKKEGDHEEEIPKPEGLRKTLGTLLYCPSCVGVWVATFFVYGYIYFPKEVWIVAAVFMLSAIERIFSTILDALKQKGA